MSKIFASKTNRAFYQTVFTVIVALGAMALMFLKAYQLSGLYLEVLIHKIKDACGCESMAQFFSMHPDIFQAVIFFGIGIGIFILYSLYKLTRIILRTKKYTEYYLSFAKIGHSAKLKGAIKSLNLDKTKIVEIDSAEIAVFCFGLWKPKICISRTLIDILEKKELKAVLAHEAQHMISYEPLKLFIVKYFRAILFFLPGIKNSIKKYITFSELAADEKASETVMSRSKLASAILKISDQEEPRWQNNNPRPTFFGSAIYERVNRLSDESYNPEFKFLDRSLVVGSLGLAIISLAFIFVFSSSTKAFEMHYISGCVSPGSQNGDLVCSLSDEQSIREIDINDIFKINSTNSDTLQQDTNCQKH